MSLIELPAVSVVHNTTSVFVVFFFTTAVVILRLQMPESGYWSLLELRQGDITPLLYGSLPRTLPLCVGVGDFSITRTGKNLSNWSANADSSRFKKTRGSTFFINIVARAVSHKF